MFGQMLDSIKNSPGSGVSSAPSAISEIFGKGLPYFFGIAGIVLVFMLISAGYKMMTSAGDPKAMQAAQAKITTSVLGIVIMFISFWIVKIILQFFGINLNLF